MKRLFVIAAVATFATAAQAAQQAATSTTATTAAATSVSTTAVAPASGQNSTSLTTGAAAPAKKWSGTFLSEISTGATEMNYTNDTDKTINALNFVGVGYKTGEKTKLGLRQYFSFMHDSKTKENKWDTSYAAMTLSQGMDGLLKSEPINATFWYYLPTTPSDYDVRSNGNLRMDAEVAWTLTPKWTASYYFNPRQSLIPNGQTMGPDGKAVDVYSKTTLVHYAVLYYNVNDTHSYYTYGGFVHRWKTSNMQIVEDRFLTALGGSYSFLGGKLSLNPEISMDNALPRDRNNTKVASTYAEKNVSYVLQTAVVF